MQLLPHLGGRVVVGSAKEVLQHRHILRVHRLRRDFHVEHVKLAVHRNRDHPPAGGAGDGDLFELLLRLLHRFLQLAHILEQIHRIHE